MRAKQGQKSKLIHMIDEKLNEKDYHINISI